MLPRNVETEHNNHSNIGRRTLLVSLKKTTELSASNTTSTSTNTTGNAQVIKDQQTVSSGAVAIVVVLIILLIAICIATFYYIHIRRKKSRRLRNMVELGTASRRLEFSLVSDLPPLPSSTSLITNDTHLAVSQMLSLSIKPESSRLIDTASVRSTSTKTKGSTTKSTIHFAETSSIFSKVGGEGSIKGDEPAPTVLSRVSGPQSSIAPPGHILKIMNVTPADMEIQSPNAVIPTDNHNNITKVISFKERVRRRMSHVDLPRISTDFGIKEAFKIELPYLNQAPRPPEESSSLDHSTSSQRNSLEAPSVTTFRRSTHSLTSSLTSPRKPRGARPIPRSASGPLRPHSAIEFSPDIV